MMAFYFRRVRLRRMAVTTGQAIARQAEGALRPEQHQAAPPPSCNTGVIFADETL